MRVHTVYIISKDAPIKYILSRSVLYGRLVTWVVILEQYDIVHVSQRAAKGQPLADFLADHPVPDDWHGEEVFFVDVLPP